MERMLETIKKCSHMSEDYEEHFFEFEYSAGRNIWNPFQPACKKCGADIRAVVMEHVPYLLSVVDKLEREAKLAKER